MNDDSRKSDVPKHHLDPIPPGDPPPWHAPGDDGFNPLPNSFAGLEASMGAIRQQAIREFHLEAGERVTPAQNLEEVIASVRAARVREVELERKAHAEEQAQYRDTLFVMLSALNTLLENPAAAARFQAALERLIREASDGSDRPDA